MCQTCNRPFAEKVSNPDEHCDDCFICSQCLRRYYYCIEDPPVLGMCSFCVEFTHGLLNHMGTRF